MSLFDEIKVLMKNVSEKIVKKDTDSDKTALRSDGGFSLAEKGLIRELPRPVALKTVKPQNLDYESLKQKYLSEKPVETGLFFEAVHIDTSLNLEINIITGNGNSYEVIGDRQAAGALNIEIKKNTLYLKNIRFTPTDELITVNITISRLTDLHLNGRAVCNISDLYADNLSIFMPGASVLNISGIAKSLNLDLTGKGRVNARDLLCDKAMVNILGSAVVTLNVDRELEAIVDGTGRLDYYGNPEKVIKNLNSRGKINNLTDLEGRDEFINLEVYRAWKAEKELLESIKTNNLEILDYIDQVAGIEPVAEPYPKTEIIEVPPEEVPIPEAIEEPLPSYTKAEDIKEVSDEVIPETVSETIITESPVVETAQENFYVSEEPEPAGIIEVSPEDLPDYDLTTPEFAGYEDEAETIFYTEPEVTEIKSPEPDTLLTGKIATITVTDKPEAVEEAEATETEAQANEYGMGSDLRERLNLTDEEVKILNEVMITKNSFTSIPQAQAETIKLCLFLVKVTETLLTSFKSSIDNRSRKLAKRSKKEAYYYDHYYWKSKILTDFFQLAEIVLRDHYGHQNKTQVSFYTSKLKECLNSPIMDSFLEEKIRAYIPVIALPTIETQIELNELNPNLWKNKFKEIEKNISQENYQACLKELELLYTVNTRNTGLNQIYFSALKILIKYDKKEALKAYINHCFYSRQQKNEPKKLAPATRKNLFKDEKQYEQFCEILETLEKDNDLELAVLALEELLTPRKKKITLDRSVISGVMDLHSETLGKLNELLGDDEPEISVAVPSVPEKTELTLQDIFEVSENKPETISFSEAQKAFLGLLVSSEGLTDGEVSAFARSNSLFKSQLINGINELSIEAFDDNLIEENDDGYVINSEYIDRVRNLI